MAFTDSSDTREPAQPAADRHILVLRPQQQAMVDVITHALEANRPIAIEAPTGTGKTYAYLIAALRHGQRFVVSTATRALQDQLVDKDIPVLLSHLGLNRKVAVLKGRENYLCLHGLAQARGRLQQLPHGGNAGTQALAVVERWAHSTQAGDLAELADISQLPALLPWITASHSECIGRRCAYHDACFSNRARQKAAQADVLVINHHLYFSELRHRHVLGMERSFVPLAATMVMDEAHQLQAIGLRVLAKGLNAADVHNYLTQVQRAGESYAKGFAPWAMLVDAASTALTQWIAHEQAHVDDAGGPAMPSRPLIALHNRLSALVAALQNVAASAAILAQLMQTGESLLASLRQWAQPPAPSSVRWWDRSSTWDEEQDAAGSATRARALRQGPRESPLWLWQSLAMLHPAVQQVTWLAQASEPQGGEEGIGRWVFTSATLGQDDSLSWFLGPIGLQQDAASADLYGATAAATVSSTLALRLRSNFDWQRQSALVVPAGLASGDSPPQARAERLAAWLLPHVQVLGGRTMVLCTSIAAMQAVAASLRAGLESCPIRVLVQGEQPKRHLLQAMRSQQHAGGQVLVGTMALWEGVDLPGDALQMLVIDKLPFPPLHDALHAARAAAMTDAGRDGFNAYTLPQTAMQLRQGVGRLIRSETDTGVVVIADDRLLHKSYGADLLTALPPMPRLGEDELPRYLQALANHHSPTKRSIP